MRFDIVTIFPDFFRVLDLSLLGKAQEKGLLQSTIHDLRDWTFDRHRSVDDTPYGGGAGMVMRADVWGQALNQIFALPDNTGQTGKKILAIPTPSGEPLTQRKVEYLAKHADQIVFACGRYEGIDSRVAAHFRAQPEIEVFEFSLGDYVLNGGEVAALALIEAVSRLCGGVIGNPESLTEESHSEAGLLEYPAYTKPAIWEDLSVPEVLLGGHHALIERWRRDRALTVTANRRADLISVLDPNQLDRQDRQVLAAQGTCWVPVATDEKNPDTKGFALRRCRFFPVGQLPSIVEEKTKKLGIWEGGAGILNETARENLWAEQTLAQWAGTISALAGELFPLACPDFLPKAEIDSFIAQYLSSEVFSQLLADPQTLILLLQIQDSAGKWENIGYTCTQVPLPGRRPKDEDVAVYCSENTCYLSKCYLKTGYHGTELSSALLEVTNAQVQQRYPWIVASALGTSQVNRRARKFYKRCGYKTVGERNFQVGNMICQDIVAVRDFTAKAIGHWAYPMK